MSQPLKNIPLSCTSGRKRPGGQRPDHLRGAGHLEVEAGRGKEHQRFVVALEPERGVELARLDAQVGDPGRCHREDQVVDLGFGGDLAGGVVHPERSGQLAVEVGVIGDLPDQRDRQLVRPEGIVVRLRVVDVVEDAEAGHLERVGRLAQVSLPQIYRLVLRRQPWHRGQQHRADCHSPEDFTQHELASIHSGWNPARRGREDGHGRGSPGPARTGGHDGPYAWRPIRIRFVEGSGETRRRRFGTSGGGERRDGTLGSGGKGRRRKRNARQKDVGDHGTKALRRHALRRRHRTRVTGHRGGHRTPTVGHGVWDGMVTQQAADRTDRGRLGGHERQQDDESGKAAESRPARTKAGAERPGGR